MSLLHHRIIVALLTLGLVAGAMPAAASAVYTGPEIAALAGHVNGDPNHTSTPGITSLGRLVNLPSGQPSDPSSTSLCSEICSGGPATQAPDLISTSLCSEVCSGGPATQAPDESGARLPHQGRPPLGVLAEQRPNTFAASPSAKVASGSVRNGGFNWGDAGIGAAGMLALAVIALGGGVALTHRRQRGMHSQPAA